MRRLAYGLCAAVMAFTATASPVLAAAGANGTDEDVIMYRQTIMKSLDAQSTVIGSILAGLVDQKNMASHFEAMKIITQQAKDAFTPKVQGGEALPVVWEKWPDFSKRFDDAIAAMDVAIKTAKEAGGSSFQTGDAAVAALTCKSCHDTYRKKK